MSLEKLAEKLNIKSYPDEFNEIYNSLSKNGNLTDKKIISEEMIEIGIKYNAFCTFVEEAKKAAEEIAKDDDILAWGNICAEFIKRNSGNGPEINRITLPECTDIKTDFLPMFLLLPEIPNGEKLYIERGFSKEEALFYLDFIGRTLKTGIGRTGRPGINKTYFWWASIYAVAEMFMVDGFNYEIRKYKGAKIYIKNKNTNEVVAIQKPTKIHKSGRILGSGGCTDEEGSFETVFSETDEYYECNKMNKNLILSEIVRYSKDEWEEFIKNGDCVISFHIPAGADFSPEKIEHGFKEAQNRVKEYYKGYEPKCFYCTSWLLDPQLSGILGENSNITKFQNMWSIYPNKNNAQDVFHYVFKDAHCELAELPEDTRLQREIKKLYLAGGGIYSSIGIKLF